MALSREQHKRARELTKAGLRLHDAKALVSMWDDVPLKERLEMFEDAGNEREAEIVRAEIARREALENVQP